MYLPARAGAVGVEARRRAAEPVGDRQCHVGDPAALGPRQERGRVDQGDQRHAERGAQAHEGGRLLAGLDVQAAGEPQRLVGDDADRPHQVDAVVVATHADQALRLLADATVEEKEVLGAFEYSRNEAWLHTDASILPSRRRARACPTSRTR